MALWRCRIGPEERATLRRVGWALRRARERKRLSRYRVELVSGVSARGLKRYEAGESVIGLVSLLKLAEVYGMELGALSEEG